MCNITGAVKSWTDVVKRTAAHWPSSCSLQIGQLDIARANLKMLHKNSNNDVDEDELRNENEYDEVDWSNERVDATVVDAVIRVVAVFAQCVLNQQQVKSSFSSQTYISVTLTDHHTEASSYQQATSKVTLRHVVVCIVISIIKRSSSLLQCYTLEGTVCVPGHIFSAFISHASCISV